MIFLQSGRQLNSGEAALNVPKNVERKRFLPEYRLVPDERSESSPVKLDSPRSSETTMKQELGLVPEGELKFRDVPDYESSLMDKPFLSSFSDEPSESSSPSPIDERRQLFGDSPDLNAIREFYAQDPGRADRPSYEESIVSYGGEPRDRLAHGIYRYYTEDLGMSPTDASESVAMRLGMESPGALRISPQQAQADMDDIQISQETNGMPSHFAHETLGRFVEQDRADRAAREQVLVSNGIDDSDDYESFVAETGRPLAAPVGIRRRVANAAASLGDALRHNLVTLNSPAPAFMDRVASAISPEIITEEDDVRRQQELEDEEQLRRLEEERELLEYFYGSSEGASRLNALIAEEERSGRPVRNSRQFAIDQARRFRNA